MKFTIIDSDSDLDRYRKLISKDIDVLFPLEYLKRSKVVVCMNKEREIFGGIMIVMKPPFRTLISIPCPPSDTHGLNLDDVAELTGLWLHPSFRHTQKATLCWVYFYMSVLRTKRSRFVYSYSLSKPKLARLYQLAKPRTIFRGTTKILPGMDESDREAVEVMEKKNMANILLYRPGKYVKDKLQIQWDKLFIPPIMGR